jgi:hypothetical protein
LKPVGDNEKNFGAHKNAKGYTMQNNTKRSPEKKGDIPIIPTPNDLNERAQLVQFSFQIPAGSPS